MERSTKLGGVQSSTATNCLNRLHRRPVDPLISSITSRTGIQPDHLHGGYEPGHRVNSQVPTEQYEPQQPPLEYDPVLYQKASCKAILNLLCFVDFRAKTWVCPFCNQRNPFPAHYAAIAVDNRPPELYPQFTTIEYTLKKATTMPPIFMKACSSVTASRRCYDWHNYLWSNGSAART
ncbi:unnamed protein product [Cylicocyclus nassatus]|uniref:Protein transport protein SEC23 n=1 Tax=Cylicocyclus nassatus TaxID=53992 RepID=A0AA36H8U9_CYLNA|nr:unnamed protein product [Cylicocyclus nassatus]